jgi:predicted ribonuclease YlaK
MQSPEGLPDGVSLGDMWSGSNCQGALLDGVPVKKGSVFIRSFAREPDVPRAVPWLDATNQDDRILTSVIEVMRAHPRSRVALVTRDINLQNKADFARLYLLEPPSSV